MGKDEVAVKKRRKLNSDASAETPKQIPTDVYKRAVEFEEREAQLRPAQKDAQLFIKFCQDIRQLLSDMAELKKKKSNEAKEEIDAKQVEASLLIVALKKLNRLEKVRTRAGRDALHKEKQRVDSTHLLLQNLLYEADHLNKEVEKCLQFRSKDEEIELVPLEDFYKDAPPEISRPEVTRGDEHQQQLARLEWELRQRRALAGACGELVAGKERVAAAIAAARSRLDALGPHLRDVLRATRPLQEALALRLDERREEARAAALLPAPLLLLYANATAYSDALGAKTVTVALSGDEDEAKRFEDLSNGDNEPDASNDSDSEQENNDEEQRGKKKRHHRTAKVSKEERAEVKKKEVLKKHPLSVVLTVGADGASLRLEFHYLLRLRIVCVQATAAAAAGGVAAGDVLGAGSVLGGLYPHDAGRASPHPATDYLLRRAGVAEPFARFIPDVGAPYVWAQRVCGLDFMAAVLDRKRHSDRPCADLSVASVENFILTLKRRLKARVALMKELQDLESGKIVSHSGAKFSSALVQWQALSWAEYAAAAAAAGGAAEGVAVDWLLYRAIATRQSAKLVALVALGGDYPRRPPVFTLTLHWSGAQHAGCSADVRDVERAVNAAGARCGLGARVAELLACVDVLLETADSPEFPPDRVMLAPVRGRTRAKPYKYVQQGTGMFVHF